MLTYFQKPLFHLQVKLKKKKKKAQHNYWLLCVFSWSNKLQVVSCKFPLQGIDDL